MVKHKIGKHKVTELDISVKTTKRGRQVSSVAVPAEKSLYRPSKRRKIIPVIPADNKAHRGSSSSSLPEPLYYESIFETFDGKTSQGKTTHDYLKAWLDQGKCGAYLDRLLITEAMPKPTCVRCLKGVATWRCLDCGSQPQYCGVCCRISHRRTPFHRVEYWNGGYFQPAWLWQAGTMICLGHQGHMCPEYQKKMSDLEKRSLKVNGCLDSPPLEEDDTTFGAKPAITQLGSGRFVLFVHLNGFHYLPVYPCLCGEKVRLPEDEQFLEAGYFPSTWTTIETVFTLELLKDYHLTKTETKMSTENYCDILKRKTNFAFPSKIDRARELSRVWQMYNYMILLKRHGFGHEGRGRKPEKGELALYCAICPQPGINLPSNWKSLTELWLYKRYIVIDGNFKLHHLIIRGQDRGISLIAGAAYMIEKAYQDKVLKNAPESKQDKDKMKKGYDASGLFGSACARHGCFCGGALVDMQKGERQANADLSVNEAFDTTNAAGTPGALLAYDINCQFCIHFRERIDKAHHLTIPGDLDITYLIGLFHIHGHGEICLPRFASTFLPGAGMASGEIIESLWSILNQAARITKTMTPAHRREMIDACVTDINWKKLVSVDTYITTQLLKARTEKEKADDDFALLNDTVSPAQKELWQEEMETANDEREGSDVSSMDSYLPKLEKVKNTRAIRSSLMAEEQKTRKNVGLANWVATGMEIQEAQSALRSTAMAIRNATEGSVTDLDVQKKREVLIKQIDNWYKIADTLFPGLDPTAETSKMTDKRDPCVCENECQCPPHIPDPDVDFELAENIVLSLPSDFHDLPEELSAAAITEGELRVAQANEALDTLRSLITKKSTYYRANRELANGTRDRTRSYDSINALEKLMVAAKRTYAKARSSLERLGLLPEHPQFKTLHKSDTKAVTAIYSPNARGQRNEGLSWIWTSLGIDPTEEGYLAEVYRVNWIRAKSRADRWMEEVIILEHEMEWFVRFCLYRQRKCLDWAQSNEEGVSAGHMAYAFRQADMWARRASAGKKQFMEKCGVRVTIEDPIINDPTT
ncbi:hypothetical protein DFP72DRAFT_1074860 [Ephemerocybe angulata]|uniref:CxC2-like cysteine cluster KDZ transposase-associated domain-containing protein n=1 Tax=Ephemerocybe angulata TaxID=980116 RepID=A0A8H6HJ38_9AGAR|nr:hypothetical protein DFP72DRAFT_1074860 [Tulosesus angulatus]